VIVLSPEIEAILKAKAARMGRTPEEVLQEILSRASDPAPWRSSVAAHPRNLSKAELIAAMEAISVRSAARPSVDLRSPEEIIGFDDFGLPR
jgi:antitoxin VapB